MLSWRGAAGIGWVASVARGFHAATRVGSLAVTSRRSSGFVRSSPFRGVAGPAAGAARAALRAAGAAVAGVAVTGAALAGVAVAASPHPGGTYRGGALSSATSLGGSLTVAANGRRVKTMRLLFLTPPCPAAPFHQSTALPATGIAIRGGSFRVSGRVRSYAESGLRGPADTTIKGSFLAGGTKVTVSLRQVIHYPKNNRGCTTQTISARGTFVLGG
jgi:hypothetical protein